MQNFRNECRELVEDYWTRFLNFAAQGSGDLGVECINQMEHKIETNASALPFTDGQQYRSIAQEERDKIFEEYTKNPESLKRRLGVMQQQLQKGRGYQRQGIGEIAVKTAVRASIWVTIWELFK